MEERFMKFAKQKNAKGEGESFSWPPPARGTQIPICAQRKRNLNFLGPDSKQFRIGRRYICKGGGGGEQSPFYVRAEKAKVRESEEGGFIDGVTEEEEEEEEEVKPLRPNVGKGRE